WGDAHLARAVRRPVPAAEEGEHGRHVDDTAAGPRQTRPRGLAGDHGGGEVDVQHRAPRIQLILPAVVADARAVDQDTELRLCRDQPREAVLVADVVLDHPYPRMRRALAADLGGEAE